MGRRNESNDLFGCCEVGGSRGESDRESGMRRLRATSMVRRNGESSPAVIEVVRALDRVVRKQDHVVQMLLSEKSQLQQAKEKEYIALIELREAIERNGNNWGGDLCQQIVRTKERELGRLLSGSDRCQKLEQQLEGERSLNSEYRNIILLADLAHSKASAQIEKHQHATREILEPSNEGRSFAQPSLNSGTNISLDKQKLLEAERERNALYNDVCLKKRLLNKLRPWLPQNVDLENLNADMIDNCVVNAPVQASTFSKSEHNRGSQVTENYRDTNYKEVTITPDERKKYEQMIAQRDGQIAAMTKTLEAEGVRETNAVQLGIQAISMVRSTSDLRREISGLKSQLDSSNQTAYQYGKENAGLLRALAEKKSEVATLAETLAVRETCIIQMENEAQKVEERRRKIEQEFMINLKEKMDVANRMENEAVVCINQNKELQERLAKAQDGNIFFENENVRLKSMIDVIEKRIKTLNAEIEISNKNTQKLVNQLAVKEQYINEVETQLKKNDLLRQACYMEELAKNRKLQMDLYQKEDNARHAILGRDGRINELRNKLDVSNKHLEAIKKSLAATFNMSYDPSDGGKRDSSKNSTMRNSLDSNHVAESSPGTTVEKRNATTGQPTTYCGSTDFNCSFFESTSRPGATSDLSTGSQILASDDLAYKVVPTANCQTNASAYSISNIGFEKAGSTESFLYSPERKLIDGVNVTLPTPLKEPRSGKRLAQTSAEKIGAKSKVPLKTAKPVRKVVR